MNRRQYLIRCATISLKRRASWVVAAAALAVAVALLLGLTTGWTALLTFLSAGVTALGIGLNSWARHSSDPEAQPAGMSESGYSQGAAQQINQR